MTYNGLAIWRFAAVLGVAAAMNGETISKTFTGSLASTETVVQESFTAGAGAITVFTTSYGGGMNLDGSSAASGGFQPMITLYDSTGKYVAGEAVTSPMASEDPSTGLSLDAYLKTDVAAGSYIVTLTNWLYQQPPTATNLSDGFVNYGGSSFIDVQGNARSAAYALNISAAGEAPPSGVPEPATFALLGPVLAGAFLLARRKRVIS